MPPLLRGVRSVCSSLDMTGSSVIKIAAVTSGSEVYEISRESGAAMLLQVRLDFTESETILELKIFRTFISLSSIFCLRARDMSSPSSIKNRKCFQKV